MWRLKALSSKGRPFDALRDIHDSALDMLWDAAFGDGSSDRKCTPRTMAWLQGYKAEVPKGVDEPVIYAGPALPPGFQAIVDVTKGIRPVMSSPFPSWQMVYMENFTKFGKSKRAKNQLVWEEIDRGVQRMVGREVEPSCAMDYMLNRERNAAKKEGRKPDYYKLAMQDEVSNPESLPSQPLLRRASFANIGV